MRLLALLLALSTATLGAGALDCSAVFSAQGLGYVPSATVRQLSDVASAIIQPIDGRIAVVIVGQSTTHDLAGRLIRLATLRVHKGGLKDYVNPAVVFVDCAKPSENLRAWDQATDPMWVACTTKLANKGLTRAQVQVVYGGLVEANTVDPLTGATITEAQMRGFVSAAAQWAPNLKQVFVSGINSPMYCAGACKVTEPSIWHDGRLLSELVEGGGWPVLSVEYVELWASSAPNPATAAVTPSGAILAPAIALDCAVDMKDDGIHQTDVGAREAAASVLGRLLIHHEWLRRNATMDLP